ncbi:hypothetical protein [Endozoicomonas sp. ALD040]
MILLQLSLADSINPLKLAFFNTNAATEGSECLSIVKVERHFPLKAI